MQNLTTGQVAEQAIERLQSRIDTLTTGVERRDLTIANLEERMRTLLSYCTEQAQHSGYALEESAYEDIAGKLRGLLDGEQ